ncbi:hypothetical protein ASD39_03325 [Sphingomonas sp. Root50]|nr:hypothetical protein ASD17_02120 [Sphingomonas sp. Root1294]KQY69336.1 hypothetical protein ASD39_03325 [Sphingomonas sp. Root50]
MANASKWTGQVSFDLDRSLTTELNLIAYFNGSYRSATNLLTPGRPMADSRVTGWPMAALAFVRATIAGR